MIFTSDQLINLHVMFLPSKEIFFISTIKLCKYCPTQHQDLKTVKSSLTHESKYTAWGFVLLGASITLTFSLAKRVGFKVPVWILFCWNANYAPLRPGALAVPTSALTVHDRIVGRAWAVSAALGLCSPPAKSRPLTRRPGRRVAFFSLQWAKRVIFFTLPWSCISVLKKMIGRLGPYVTVSNSAFLVYIKNKCLVSYLNEKDVRQ